MSKPFPIKTEIRDDAEITRTVEALYTLSQLGLIEWRSATAEEDSLEIDQIGELTICAHDGWCMSPYLIVNGIYLHVGKQDVRRAWGKP